MDDAVNLVTQQPAPSAVGNLTDLAQGQVLLPAFVERRADGLYVFPEAVPGTDGFRLFVEGVFAAGARFRGLDYPLFQKLLYEHEAVVKAPARLAEDIVPFAPERRALYRAVKIAPDRSEAEYMFEPVEIEVAESFPLFGDPGPDGMPVIVGEEIRKRGVPAQLDFDEFVADMWQKGVRFGIDAPGVQRLIASRQIERKTIARLLAATPGQDATLQEKSDTLHRDNTPKILADGRMDLRQFKNRFPQVNADTRLLQKIPRRLGKPGRDVGGQLLEPEIPKDFDLQPLAGPGTRIEVSADGEFIVAARDGFINIDGKSNQISVMEKIVSHEGVSMKATGDVVLSGDEFEEHGEVQERRVVEGLHMTFFAAVYGNVVSRGGRIVLKDGIAGGQATSPGGSITVAGRASRATLEARGGEVHVEFAEGCAIVGSKVSVQHAVNCEILGEEVSVELSEGCAVAGKRVRIAISRARKDIETIVAILTPDMTRNAQDISALEQARAELEQKIAAAEGQLAQMMAETEFKQFLALAMTIAKGGTRLSAEHEAKWRSAQARFAPQMKVWQATQQELAQARTRRQELAAELAALAEAKLHAGDDIACTIAEVGGDTLVRRMAYQPDQSVVGGTQARDIAAHLREYGTTSDRLFWASHGSFAWTPGGSGGAAV